MRAPILNDRGQFRYSDFVAYVPEFLKAEPDVVTLLQVFSDYINNAYRNIDTVEKFEFAIVSRSDTIGRATRRMEYLRTMLDLAGSRHDFVNLLSVPRANINSNRVFGQANGYIPMVVPYSASEILDEIPNAQLVVPGIATFDDGDVIFISYDGLETGNREVAYYYDSARKTLIREPMGKSQDPFTGSDNSSGRVISFHVSDVSQVKTRYGYTSKNGTQYKEVFFTARIYDVQSAPSVKRYMFNSNVDGMIDYYGTETCPAGVISSTMRFYGNNGWSWKDGFPTAMFYLSETSGASLISVVGDGKHLPFGMCADPSLSNEYIKYNVSHIESCGNGTILATLDTFYPSYANSTVFLARKRTMELNGPYTVIRDTRESGSYNVILIPNGIVSALNFNDEYVIIDAPLFYDRGMLDYSKASPLITIDHAYPIDVNDAGEGIQAETLIPNENMCAYAYDSMENEVVGTLNICYRGGNEQPEGYAYMDGVNTIVVPFNSMLGKNFGDKYDIGDELYIRSGYMYWSGVGIVESVTVGDGGYAIKLRGVNIHPHQLPAPVNVYVNRHGYLTLETDSSGNQAVTWLSRADLYSSDGNIVVFEEIGSNNIHVRRLNDQSKFNGIDLPNGSYALCPLVRTGSSARNLVEVSGDEHLTTIWNKYKGDMFTCSYVMLTDNTGNSSICSIYSSAGNKVVPIERGHEYHKGQYVFNGANSRVYYCVEDCIVTDENTVTMGNSFVEDRIVHFSVPYVSKINPFVPFYGQIAALEYGAQINYDTEPEVFLSPLYISKVEEKRLKYGWQHREFLNYGDTMNLSGRARNGMVEFYSTSRTNDSTSNSFTVDAGMDIVNADLGQKESVPFTVFAQNNLFDLTNTNPSVALGDEVTIRNIIYTGNGRATIHIASPLVHFNEENRPYIEGKTVVYITNVTPSDFCGYHVVTKINSPTSFEVSMRLYNKTLLDVDSQKGIPTGDLKMTLRECRWYKYRVNELEWEKRSSIATFTGNNATSVTSLHVLACDSAHGLAVHDEVILSDDTHTANATVVAVPSPTEVNIKVTAGKYVNHMIITSINGTGVSSNVRTTEGSTKELVCAHAHGLAANDYVVFGYDFSTFDDSTGLDNYAMGRVIKVNDETRVLVDIILGSYVDGMSIARGVITQDSMDNLSKRNGEYSIRLRSLIGSNAASPGYNSYNSWILHTFRDGDIVIAAGQVVPSERVAYLVRENVQWTVLKKKRIMKIRNITVDEYQNADYQYATEDDNVDEYKYATYSDVDVAKMSREAYASRMFMIRNPIFNKPAIPDIDTTREVNAEYSSGEDFGNIAPRDDMKPTFTGIPDMKYPLIEKIERLAYLRDANVIDFELIGYLARFMGYDLTPMADDIESSNLYRTIKQRESAIREAVLNLPQYYALGGTDAGIKMIMGAFGVIGDILTLYTNTMHPYEEMLNKDEVENRVANDSEGGKLTGTWVATPYIDIELTDDARYPQFAIHSDDISRIKEQIRLWKPINVVFRDILLRYVGEIGIKASITGPFIGIEEFGAAIGLGDGENDTVVELDYVEPGLTNCAF